MVVEHAAQAMDPPSTSAAELASVAWRLRTRFCPPLRAEEVERCIAGCVARFDGARVRRFVPILVERAATERLVATLADRRPEPPR